MPQTKTTTVFEFDELNERAKDRAREWFRDGSDFVDFGADSVLEDAARIADIIGINLRQRPVRLMGGGTRNEPDVYWEVGDRNEGASFSGSYAFSKGSVKALAAEAPAEYQGKPQASNAIGV